MTEFSSVFGQRISNFLDYRTARNFKKETYLRHFIKFDDWCMDKHPEEFLLSCELVLDWLSDSCIASYNTAQRVASMRQFAKYLCAIWRGSVYSAGKIRSTQKQGGGISVY